MGIVLFYPVRVMLGERKAKPMFETFYQLGFHLMAYPVLPGFISAGAILIQGVRACDPDAARAAEAQAGAEQILRKWRELENDEPHDR